jgi:hypothetical protein
MSHHEEISIAVAHGWEEPASRRSSKAQIVVPAAGDQPVKQIAPDFNLTETVVRQSTEQADCDVGMRNDGATTAEPDGPLVGR